MKEMYVSLSAAVAHERNLAVIANNLANVNSAGFKREMTVFEVAPPQTNMALLAKSASSELSLPAPAQAMEGVDNYMRIAQTAVDFSHGELRPGTNPFDMALQETDPKKGVAFFVVETPQGDCYTRAGNFLTNSKQELVTADGLRVRGKDGNAINITSSPIEITAAGDISSKGRPLGSLKVAYFDKPENLEKVGNGLFSDQGGAARNATATDGVSVRQGCLETSNVNAVAELVRMIETQQAYTGYQKSIQSIDDTAQKAISQVMGQ